MLELLALNRNETPVCFKKDQSWVYRSATVDKRDVLQRLIKKRPGVQYISLSLTECIRTLHAGKK